MMFASLRTRLIAAMLLVLVAGGGCIGVFLSARAHSASELLEETSLLSQANELLRTIKLGSDGRPTAPDPRAGWRDAYNDDDGAFFSLYDHAGALMARSVNLSNPLPLLPVQPGSDHGPLQLTGPKRWLAQAFTTPGDGRLIVARTNPGLDIDTDRDRLADLAPVVIFALAMVAALLLVELVVHWSLAPLRRAAIRAGEIGPNRPDARLDPAPFPSEARPLADAVNRALDRVSMAYAAERRFTADAAHALRTPLTVLDLRVQLLESGRVVEPSMLRKDADELKRIVGGLLALARGEAAGRPPRPVGRVNLARLVREAAADAAPLLEIDHRELLVELPESAMVRGDPHVLKDALAALFDNARTHGSGCVRAKIARSGKSLEATISDEGAGVPISLQDTAFDRFSKIAAASPGAGLGLAIVRQAVENYGGTVAFSAPAAICVTLPAE